MWIRDRRGRAALTSALALAAALGASGAAAQNTPRAPGANAGSVTTPRGVWDWGLGVNLLRLGALRRPEEPGYLRNYEAEFRWLSPQFTFQVTFQPNFRPWRMASGFQSMSVSGVIITGIDTSQARKSELALGLTVDFLNGIVGVGVALDLYRGVPVRDGAGTPGGDVAPTGLFSAAFLRGGEVTPENVFFLLNLNFVAIGRTAATP
ncbi:MAG: hypothetical protein U0324_46890 [Polyangiales bacterium]